jgi:hypothetical protein
MLPGPRPRAGGGGQVLVPTSAVKAVCRQIAPKILAWDWSEARMSFPVLEVSSVG